MKDIWKSIKENIKANKKSAIIYLIAVIITYMIMFSILPEPESPEEVTYNEFLEYLDNGEIDTVYYNKNAEMMKFTLYNDETRDMPLKEREEYDYEVSDTRLCKYPNYDSFRKEILEKDTNIEVYSIDSVPNVIYGIFQLAFPLIFLFFLLGIMRGQIRGISEKDVIQTSDVTFDDVIGQEEIIDDIKFITSLIKDPTKGDKVGAKLPKGILFTGPPGTGKTLIAKAIAHEAGVPFLYQNASSIIEMYVGLGAKRVRDLFKIARNNAPCILFIDEIDALGKKRDSNTNTSENDQVINAILQEMDGFNGREGVFVIAATNRPDVLDDALVRSGRFDRQIVVAPPRDWTVRRDLFNHYLKKFAVSSDVDVDNISKQVSGYTGADIAMICNEASMIAVQYDKDAIDTACLEEAIDKKDFKSNRSKTNLYEHDRVIIAYHEAGHAIMSMLLNEPIARANIQATVSGVGGVVRTQDKTTVFVTAQDMEHSVMIAYAGRAAEELKFDSVTTGASNDITKATHIMVEYIEKLGFNKEFGLLDVGVLAKEHLVNSDILTDKLQQMSIELYDKSKQLLKENYDKVEILAQKLLDVETLSGADIEALFS